MDNALIVEYLLGQLPEPEARVVEDRLRRDAGWARECAATADALAGIAYADPAPRPGEGLRERVLGSVAGAQRFDGFARRLARLFDVDEARALKLARRAAKGPGWGWLPYHSRGVHVLPVRCGPALAGARGVLVHLARGTNLPRHRHGGTEQMLILDGYACENRQRVVAPGDLVVSEQGSEHQFEILQDAPCVFACTLAGGIDWLADTHAAHG